MSKKRQIHLALPHLLRKLSMASAACLLIVLTAATAFGQHTFGLKAGYTRAWEAYGVTLPEDADINIERFHITAEVYKPLNSWLKFGIEPGYVQRGAACVPGWMPTFEGDTRYFLHYIEAPIMLMARKNFGKDKWAISGKIGVGASYMFMAYEEVTIFNNGDGPDNILPPSRIVIGELGRLRRTDVGAYAGMGLSRRMGKGSLLLETEYYHGIRNPDKSNRSRNRSVDISLGYRIDLNL